MNAIVVNFFWLLELFHVERGRGGQYADKLLERITQDAHEAHWFEDQDEARRFLDKAPKAGSGFEWRVTEHGFIQGATSV